MWSARLAGLVLMLFISGCGISGSGINSGCEWTGPIFVSKDDVLTDGTARAILVHNETWLAVCGR